MPALKSREESLIPEAAGTILNFKEQYYADWLKQPLPALSGKTPKQAVRTKAGRKMVDLLLKDLENRESRLPEDHRMGFKKIREELGLEI